MGPLSFLSYLSDEFLRVRVFVGRPSRFLAPGLLQTNDDVDNDNDTNYNNIIDGIDDIDNDDDDQYDVDSNNDIDDDIDDDNDIAGSNVFAASLMKERCSTIICFI